MKILIVRAGTTIIDFNAYNCQELGLAKALSRRGYKVYITTPDNKYEHVVIPVEGYDSVEIFKLKLFSINKIACWHYNVGNVLKEINPNIIHLNGFESTMCLYYVLWGRKHGCKNVMIEGMYELTHKPIKRILQKISMHTLGLCVLNHVDCFGGKTKWVRQYIQNVKKVPVALTRIGLDTTKFEHAEQIEWREKLNIVDKKILLYVGILEERRNPLFLVNIIKRLPKEYVLVIAGTGPMSNEVNNLVMKLCLQDRVIQLGKQPQEKLPSLYKTSDLFLLASSYEIYGMVLLESMFFGLPVVSTLTAGSDCIIDNGKDGIIINELNLEKWTSIIQDTCNNREQYEVLRQAASDKIHRELIWDRTVEEFINLYN